MWVKSSSSFFGKLLHDELVGSHLASIWSVLQLWDSLDCATTTTPTWLPKPFDCIKRKSDTNIYHRRSVILPLSKVLMKLWVLWAIWYWRLGRYSLRHPYLNFLRCSSPWSSCVFRTLRVLSCGKNPFAVLWILILKLQNPNQSPKYTHKKWDYHPRIVLQ